MLATVFSSVSNAASKGFPRTMITSRKVSCFHLGASPPPIVREEVVVGTANVHEGGLLFHVLPLVSLKAILRWLQDRVPV